jgi:hypothetical protein
VEPIGCGEDLADGVTIDAANSLRQRVLELLVVEEHQQLVRPRTSCVVAALVRVFDDCHPQAWRAPVRRPPRDRRPVTASGRRHRELKKDSSDPTRGSRRTND